MKPLSSRHRKAREWGKKDRTWEDQARQFTSAFHRGAVRSGASARTKFYKATHGEFSLPKPSVSKGKAILLLVLIGIGAIFIADQAMKTLTGVSPLPVIDPSTYIWTSSVSGDFNTFRTSVDSTGFILVPNSTHTAVAVSENNIGDLSIVSGKTLAIAMAWTKFNGTCCNSGTLGWYLTTNGTVPTELSYDPASDKSVALLVTISVLTSPNIQYDLYVQRTVGETIVDENTGTADSGGSGYISQTNTISPVTYQVSSYIYLNYTGTAGPNQCSGSGNTGMGCSSLSTESTPSPPAATAYTKSGTIPWFQFQAKQYYMGIFAKAGAPFNPKFLFNCGLSGTNACNSANTAFSFLPTAVVVTPSPTIDTGGFFGPVIRALIGIGVFILTSIAAFLGYVADVFVTAMNAVGNFFRLGNVGTAIRDFLTGVSNFIINVVTTVFGWGVTFASLFQNGISFISNFLSGSNGFIAWIISFFTSAAGLWAIIQDLWNSLNTVVLTMNQILVFDYLIGMFWVYMDGWPGFKNWLDLNTTLILKLLKGAWWVGRETTTVVLDVKRFLAQWL